MSASGGTIAPEKILRELTNLWTTLGHEDAANGATHQDDGVLRACSMTLVAMVEESDDIANLGETIASLMPEHPARAIVIRLHGAGERMLSERVYAQCWKPFGQQRQICCEQVEITASDSALADLPPVVLPLTVADLPLILWCRSWRLMELPEFGPIAGMAQKIVLDSSDRGDAKAALERTAALSAGVMTGDLAWTRLTRWREIIAQIFENRQNLAQLATVASVAVRVSGQPSTAAYYLGAWIMDALASAGVSPSFAVEDAGAVGSGELHSVKLSGSGFEVTIERRDDRLVATANGLSNCMHLPADSDYRAMREELGVVRRDLIFEKALARAVTLASGARS